MIKKKAKKNFSLPVVECTVTDKGKEYKGRTSVTKSGRPCQYWERQFPHKHSFGKLSTEHNYCRNPDDSGRPWCYTSDPGTRWEYCEIPACGKMAKSSAIIIKHV